MGAKSHRRHVVFGLLTGIIVWGAISAATAYGAPAALGPVATAPVQSVRGGNDGTPSLAAGVTGGNVSPGAQSVSPDQYRAEKERAATDQGASPAQALAKPAAPPTFTTLATTTNTFGGASYQTHFGLGLPYCCAPINPPDTILAKSPNRVLQAVNSSIRLYDTAGTVIQHSSLNQFFCSDDRPCREYLFDPKLYFDANAPNPRFYSVALEVVGKGDADASNDFSRIWLAVSRSQDPTSLSSVQWCRYAIEGKYNAGASWADYPGLGVGADSLLLSTNQFNFNGNAFTHAIVRVFNKLTLSNNAAACPSLPSPPIFQPAATAGDFNFFTLQPAQHYTSPSSFAGQTNPAYLVSTIRPTSGPPVVPPDNRYRVYRIYNVASGSPLMQSTTVTGSVTYNHPPSAPGGDGANIDTGDVRVTQTAGIGNAVSAVHATSCLSPPAGGGSVPTESCARTVRFIVGGAGALTATLSQQTVFGFADGFAWWPGVAVNNTEDTAISFQFSNASTLLAAAYAVKPVTTPDFSASTFIRNGFCLLETGFDSVRGTYRSGDYTGAQRDTDGVGFWVSGERATTFGTNTFPNDPDTSDPTCQWQTWINRVIP
jgi:hypothetical protein